MANNHQARLGTCAAPLPSRAQRDLKLLSAMRCQTSIAGAPILFAQSIKRQSAIKWTSTMRAFFPLCFFQFAVMTYPYTRLNLPSPFH